MDNNLTLVAGLDFGGKKEAFDRAVSCMATLLTTIEARGEQPVAVSVIVQTNKSPGMVAFEFSKHACTASFIGIMEVHKAQLMNRMVLIPEKKPTDPVPPQ